MQVDPIKPKLKSPGTKRLKLDCDVLLSTSAFKFNLRRYILVEKPTWRPCRHFHREGDGLRAVRHRWSGLHSFRTIICGEWVIRGTVTYELHFPRLEAPCAVGIGVVNPQAGAYTRPLFGST